jgi:3-oxoacyl-(acyl-carrier-protein) synthase
MESAALRTIFGEHCPPVSGVKGMLGHTLGAAGIVESVVCVLAMQEGLLPGTPRLSATADGVPTSCLTQPVPASRLHHILKLSTGFGGVNAALILSHV